MKVDFEIMMEINTLVHACKKYFRINDYYKMDYLHDAFIKVVEKIDGSYKDVGKFDSWVRTVAVNSVKTGLRRDMVNELCLCELVDNYNFISCNTGICELRRKVVLELVLLALEDLPSDDYEMVVGRMNGKSCSKLADEMSLNIKTIRKHLTKSYAKIRSVVRSEYYNRYHEDLEVVVF